MTRHGGRLIPTIVIIVVIAAAISSYFVYTSTFPGNHATTDESTIFGPPWHFVENTTLTGQNAELVCNALRLPCPSSPSFVAQEYDNGTVIAYAVFSTSYGTTTASTTHEVVIINNTVYCVSPQLSFDPQCPSMIN